MRGKIVCEQWVSGSIMSLPANSAHKFGALLFGGQGGGGQSCSTTLKREVLI